jgi:hypothetical protein
MNNIEFISFSTAGYGHVEVSGYVDGAKIKFTTSDTTMTDAAQDEDDICHEQAMKKVESLLIKRYNEL